MDDVDSCGDVHPTIITDEDRHIEVLVAEERQGHQSNHPSFNGRILFPATQA